MLHPRSALVAALLLGASCTGSTVPGPGAPSTPDSAAPPADNPPPPPAVDGGVAGPVTVPPAADASTAPPAADAALASDGAAAPPSTSAGDDLPDRPLNVDKGGAQLYTIKFKPSEADPATMGNDAVQTAYLDTRAATIRGKLVVTLSGTNNPPGPLGLASYAAGLGFHSFAVAYFNAYSPLTPDPDFFGQARFDEFDGMGRQTKFKVGHVDSVENRVTKALTFLKTKNPQGDWDYYLKKDGTVRWSDVIFFGQSHGATSAAAFAKVRRVWRAVSMSGPRDTNPVVATWLTMPSATPIDRFYGFTGTGDGQHPDHLKAMDVMGYIGKIVDITNAKPPYDGSHRLQYNGSHTADLTCAPFDGPCQYMLGTLQQ